MNHTPNLVAWLGFPSRNFPSRSIGDQMTSPYIACDDELTMTPKKVTMEKHRGTAMSWGQSAAEGLIEREEKSGAFLDTQRHLSEC